MLKIIDEKDPINDWQYLFVYGTLEFEATDTETSFDFRSNTKGTFSCPIVLAMYYNAINFSINYPDMANTANNGVMAMAYGFSVVDPDYATHKDSPNRDYGAFIENVVKNKEHYAIADYAYSSTRNGGDCTVSASGKISTNNYGGLNAVYIYKVFKGVNKTDYGYKFFFQYMSTTNSKYVHITGCNNDRYEDEFLFVEERIFGGSAIFDNGSSNPEYGFDINKADMDSFIKNPKSTLEIPFEGKITLYEGRTQTIKGTLSFN